MLEVGQQARGRKLFLRVGLGGCGTLVAPVQGSLGKSPAAQGDPEQGGRRGLGGQAEGEPGVPQLNYFLEFAQIRLHSVSVAT